VLAEANWGNWLEASLGATPTVDGDIVPTTPQQALLKGSFAKNVDVLVGTNQNEGGVPVPWILCNGDGSHACSCGTGH